MKKILFILLCILAIKLSAKDFITIYNNDFALIKSQIELNLEKGVQNYLFDDIPSAIEATSLIFKSNDNKLKLYSQNYEYDLAGTDAILNKFINSEISVLTNDNLPYSGVLKFYDGQNLGLMDAKTSKLKMLSQNQIKSIDLSYLPDNFYTKPSLKWQINAPSKGKYPVELSYISSGLSWYVTYNTVYSNNKLNITPWVTLSNVSGKAFNDINLKLLAGDVNKKVNARGGRPSIKMAKDFNSDIMETSAPQFNESQFANYHIYALNQSVDIANKQTKQIVLFENKTVNCKKYYVYNTYGKEVWSKIEFENKESEGLGLPLPKGIVKIYQKDISDNNLEFIGEDEIDHSPIEKTVTLNTGRAFDITSNTIVSNDKRLGKEQERDIEVKIENKMKEDIEIKINHNFSAGEWTLVTKNFDYMKNDAYSITISQKIKANSSINLKWTQRVKLNY